MDELLWCGPFFVSDGGLRWCLVFSPDCLVGQLSACVLIELRRHYVATNFPSAFLALPCSGSINHGVLLGLFGKSGVGLAFDLF